MARILSVLLDSLSYLHPDIPGLAVHGANLITAQMLRQFANDERVEVMEVFLPPSVMIHENALGEVARTLLSRSRRGRGILRFYPFHSIPEIWGDGLPRTIYSMDPERLTRDRYLRDRFAVGPTPIFCDSHALGHHRLWSQLVRIANAPHVPYDTIACISKACRDGLAKSFTDFLSIEGAPPPCRLDLLYHGCDTDRFAAVNPQRRADSRRLLRLPQDGQIALFLGRVTPNSKADLLPLINVFSRVAGENDYLVIAGQENATGYLDRMRQTGDECGMGERLIICPEVAPGFQSLYYHSADIFVFPADCIQESLANTVIEAMACGLPTLISDWDGMRDLVLEGETGFKIPCYWMPNMDRIGELSMTSSLETEYLYGSQSVWIDTNILADRLGELLQSPELRERMGSAGRERILKEFSLSVIRDKTFQLWDQLDEIAAHETEEEAQFRKDYASRIGLPTPYLQLFNHYATGVLDPLQDSIRLNPTGRAVMNNRQPLQFYDELLPLLHQDIINSLFETLSKAGSRWLIISEITRTVSLATGKSEDDIRYHLGLLLKRDLLELNRKNS